MKINKKICGFTDIEDTENDTSQEELSEVQAEIKDRPNIQNSPNTASSSRDLLDKGKEALKGLMKQHKEVIGKKDFNDEDNNLQDRLEKDILDLST